MNKQFQIRMINLTLATLSDSALTDCTPATLKAIAFWQSALNRVTGAL